MSYAVSKSLQGAVYSALSGDATLSGLVGSNVFDAVPAGVAPDLYVSLGPEDVSTRTDSSGTLTTHRIIISVVGSSAGFSALKDAAGAVSDILDGADLTLSRGTLVAIDFEKARARKTTGNSDRRIDLWFRAIVQDS